MNDPPVPIPYRDRTAGLILVGILEICLGLVFLAGLGFMALAVLAVGASTTAPQTLNVRTMLGAGSFYLLLAAFFGTLGIGTLLGRRWARTLMLVLSWMWLVIGVFSLATMIFILPKMLKGMQAISGTEAGVPAFMTGCTFLFLGLAYLVLPGILLLFYRSPHVKATVEAKDPSVPWTDRTPAPVLALSLMLGYGAVASLLGVSYGVFPVFGRIVTGLPAILGFLLVAVLCAILAVALYRRLPAAWWAATGLWILGCVSGAFFFASGGPSMREMYEAMGMATPELERMGIYDMWNQPALNVLMIVGALAWLGYLLWVRKFFRPAG